MPGWGDRPMTATLRRGSLTLAVLLIAGAVATAAPRAASPSDAAGVPFVTFAHALAQGDYVLACAQLSDRALLDAAPRLPNAGPIRTRCPAELEAEADGLDKARLASTRVVAVRVTPGRARVTVQTTFADIQPIATGTAIVEGGAWKILETPSDAHVGTSYLYTIPSESMLPTLRIGDTALVDHAAYKHVKPKVGDIVVFHPPAGAGSANECAKRPPEGQACAVATRRTAGTNFIKRIVAKPGDRISIRKGRVVRNGKLAREPFITPCDEFSACDFPRTFTVAAGRYYVLGDNRAASDDSRYWGPVAAKAIVGRLGRVIPRPADPATGS
jgi:signal peptidase I